MDKTQFILALIGSAAIGAFVSSLITEIGKWRERQHRRKELVFQASVDFAKMLFEYRETGLGLAQLSMIPHYFSVLQELFDKGRLSSGREQDLVNILAGLDSTKKPK